MRGLGIMGVAEVQWLFLEWSFAAKKKAKIQYAALTSGLIGST